MKAPLKLLSSKWQQSNVTSTLNCNGYLALMLCTVTGDTAR